MVNVYCNELTARVEYSFKLIFETILGTQVHFHTNAEAYSQAKGIQINYSKQKELPGFKVSPNALLFQNYLEEQTPDITEWEGIPVIFSTRESTIPFDVFAATFYLVTRYEEYLPGKRDNYYRYKARYSLAGVNNFLEKPLVNIWALKLADQLEKEYGTTVLRRPSFRFIPTFDIDNAYAFKHKGFIRNLFSTFRDIRRGNWTLIRKRHAVLYRLSKDPYDNYDFMLDTLKAHNYSPITFFLLNNKGRRDRSLSPFSLAYRYLIRQMAEAGQVGIHPSYASNRNRKQLTREVKRLKEITGSEVIRSRQHYLKLIMPKTYRQLISEGIKEDYTMGYPTRPGFRASICTPHYFFDIQQNETTSLMVFPFQVMDVTLRQYRGLRATDAIRKISKLMEETYAVGGTFVPLWHNESLSDEGQWKGWREVFISMVKSASEKEHGKH
jgi:hypothetical protein